MKLHYDVTICCLVERPRVGKSGERQTEGLGYLTYALLSYVHLIGGGRIFRGRSRSAALGNDTKASSLRLRLDLRLSQCPSYFPRHRRSIVVEHKTPSNTTTMNLFPSWKHFFAARESNDAGNKNPAARWTAWSDPDTTAEAKLHLVKHYPSTAILAGDNNMT